MPPAAKQSLDPGEGEVQSGGAKTDDPGDYERYINAPYGFGQHQPVPMVGENCDHRIDYEMGLVFS